MNKKQRNRKDVQQNMRNRLVNKRYKTTIKTLSKLLDLKIKNLSNAPSSEDKAKEKIATLTVLKNLYSTDFFEDVKVPKDNLIGEEGKGWTDAKYLLEFERGNGYSSALYSQLQKIKENITPLLGSRWAQNIQSSQT